MNDGELRGQRDDGEGSEVNRRKLIVGFVVFAATAAAVGVLASRTPEIRARFNQIREGMTYDEVTTILGQPDPDHIPLNPWLWVYWEGRDGTAYVGFDGAKKRVELKHFQPARASFLSQVLGWLGL